jgi:ribosomal protein S27AE
LVENVDSAMKSLVSVIQSNIALTCDYEILEYRVRDDLGNRYGRLNDGTIDDHRTVMFIRYWDAACRYILEILTTLRNWDSNVDVWGIPHLVNNSLGAWLRLSNAQCARCSTSMYLATHTEIPQQLRQRLATFSKAPICLFLCPQCSSVTVASTNI